MNKLIGDIVLGASLLVPMLSEAATFTLGAFPGTTGFSDATPNSGVVTNRNQLPLSGPFSDDWNFTVGPNTGGSANVGITGVSSPSLTNVTAAIVGAGNFNLLFSNTNNQLLGLNFGSLNPGNYTLQVKGFVDGGATNEFHSYSGSLNVVNNVSNVPVPGALWLFGSTIAGLVGISRRKKR